MKMKHFFIAVALVMCGQCYAQSGRGVHGTIIDSLKQPLPSGIIKLVSETRDSMVTTADANGKFVFRPVKGRQITVTAYSIGYLPATKHYTLKANDTDLGAIILKKEASKLPRLVATVLKEDTLGYQANAYTPRGNMAEILKKMPGVAVDASGNVTAQGNQVTKIRINGKDYVGGDVKGATKNLPADVVQKIQVIENYGDQANITGIKTGEPKKILNVTINGITQTLGDNESYEVINENSFNDVKSNPLSTFSVDVDAASYSNVRRFINNGQLPPANAVRIEEMINYFSYNLPGPTNNSPVAIHTELSSAPWNAKHRLVRIGLKAKSIDMDKLPPSNLVFLIDVSGSMYEANKLPLVQASMKLLVEQLRPQDRVAIVTYAGEAGVALASTAGDQKTTIEDAIDKLAAAGSTNGGGGIKMAYRIAKENFMATGNNRIIMATDGDFNVGPSSDEDMEQLITKERDSKVAISIMGFGMGNVKDSKMETLADKGNGNYFYIDNITEAKKALVNEFSSTLFTIARDVKLQVEFNPAKVQAYRLLGYEDRMLNKEDFNNDKKDAGDMGSGHTVTALYEIVAAGIKDDYAGTVDPLKYQKPEPVATGNGSDEMMTIKFRYKKTDSSASDLESVIVNDKPEELKSTSVDFRFAAAVAEFGMLLRDSQFKEKSSFDQVISMAKAAKGEDQDGYRSEFVRLAESAKLMTKTELVSK